MSKDQQRVSNSWHKTLQPLGQGYPFGDLSMKKTNPTFPTTINWIFISVFLFPIKNIDIIFYHEKRTYYFIKKQSTTPEMVGKMEDPKRDKHDRPQKRRIVKIFWVNWEGEQKREDRGWKHEGWSQLIFRRD